MSLCVALGADGRTAVLPADPLPDGPSAHELELRVLAVGICGTDVTLASGSRAVPSHPWVLGHEAVGEVTRVGADVTGWEVGQVGVLEPNVADLTCEACRSGFTSACANRTSSGVLTQPGFLAQQVVHPAGFVHHAPAGASVEDLVCVEPMAVAQAAIRRAGVGEGDRMLVLGAGSQGLLATQILRARGVEVIVTDLCDERVERARTLGARRLDPAQDRGFAHVLDTTGSAEAIPQVLAQLAVGAQVTVVGESAAPVALSSQEVVHRQLVLRGSFIYDHPRDFADVLAGIGSGALAPRRILRPPTTLADAAALLTGRTDGAGKPWVDLRDHRP